MSIEVFLEYDKHELTDHHGKVCISCKELKPYSLFQRHSGNRDKHDGRCRQCIKEQTTLRKKLKLTAPPKPKTCDCCGNIKTLGLDHCHKEHKFRGWLCHHCNAGIGQLGDDIESVKKAMAYLERYYDTTN
jgi:hypothetical protein